MGNFLTLDNGDKIFIDERGSGPALICVHGLGGGAYFFREMAEDLKDIVKTIAIDLPGAGLSPRGKTPFSLERCAEIVLEIAAKRASGPVMVMGHSLGTIVALKAYQKNPEAFSRLMFVGGLPEATPESKARLIDLAARVRKDGLVGLGDSLLIGLVSPMSIGNKPTAATLLHRLLELNDPISFAEMAEALAKASASDVVPTVNVECLGITGGEDNYAPPAAMEALMESLPKKTYYSKFPGCGHAPFLEAPEAFSSVVRDFLKD